MARLISCHEIIHIHQLRTCYFFCIRDWPWRNITIDDHFHHDINHCEPSLTMETPCIFRWDFQGELWYPLVFLSFSHWKWCFPMVFPWFSYGFPMDSPGPSPDPSPRSPRRSPQPSKATTPCPASRWLWWWRTWDFVMKKLGVLPSGYLT